MKRISLLVFGMLLVGTASGQVARWVIPPAYDSIHVEEGSDLIVADSLDAKVLWTLDGIRRGATSDEMAPFREGYSLAFIPASGEVTGFFSRNGAFTPLPSSKITYDYPFFSEGKVLLKGADGYFFADTEGVVCDRRFLMALPFSGGYASCTAYQNEAKQKSPYHFLMAEDYSQVPLSFNGKRIEDNDVEFISSLNDAHLAVIVVRHKLFFFDGVGRTLSPVYPTGDETNLKNQARLAGEWSQELVQESDSTCLISARCGKAGMVSIRFDRLWRPVTVMYPDREENYVNPPDTRRPVTSMLRRTESRNKFGIDGQEGEVLPPQFEQVALLPGRQAFVRLGGKYGMLAVHEDEHFRLSMNKGNDIAFRHQKFETVLRLDLPIFISSGAARVEIDPDSGCDIDRTSRVTKDTEFGNFIQYDCVLTIPPSLPDEISEICYPVRVQYDGLVSPEILFKVRAWHYKYFNVDINDSETTLENGMLSMTFNINAERNPGEDVFPTTVNIQTDSLEVELEKLSETRYKCKVMELAEGVNNIVVQILEQGCPPASFPFEITYTRPVAEMEDQPAVKEEVVIKKKAKKVTPHLDL